MEHITYFRRREQKGEIRLRFRLQDTERGVDKTHPNGVDLYHKSDIVAKVEDLDRLNLDGTFKDKVLAKNKAMIGPLSNAIQAEIKIMAEVYSGIKKANLIVDSKTFHDMIEAYKHPDKVESKENKTLLAQFRAFYQQYEELDDDGKNISLVFRDYQVLDGKLERYLKVIGQEAILTNDFSDRELMDFHRFMIDEYKYAAKAKYSHIYEGMMKRNIPTKQRSQNTVATEIKKLRTFYIWYAKKHDDLGKTPFERLTDAELEKITSEDYDEAICLTKDEFMKVQETEVPASLQETKDVFLLQCNFGARIEDFKKWNMGNVMVDVNGIPYLRYLPHKTLKKSKDDIETPILRYSLDIIKKYRFQFPILKYVTGKSGYNIKIKELMKFCGIDRGCKVYNAKTQSNDIVPLWEKASSKLCRKTFVDMMNKAQIDEYAAGLHKKGSGAVKRYTNMSLQDRFNLMCFAFSQPIYAVDKSLNVVDVKANKVDELQRKADALKALIAEKTASLPAAPTTQEEFLAWSKAMSEITTCNQQLNEINAKLIEELKK